MIVSKTWRLIDSAMGSASWNMAVDEALLNGLKEGDLPILRLYGWENALSVGKFSNIAKCLDEKKVEEQKLPIVRRMSGGGILVHGGDLSYAMILPRELLRDRGVKENYHHLCGFLIQLYKRLGHDARFAYDLRHTEAKSDICLAGIEAYDLIIEGKKMGGNAQRYTRHVLFQHGTIPMSLDEESFKPLFVGDCGLERAATLEQLGTPVAYKQLVELIIEAFSETFEVNLLSDCLRPSEESEAKKLLTYKYTEKRWNYDAKYDHP